MLVVPDFQKANFTFNSENPFRLSPPRLWVKAGIHNGLKSIPTEKNAHHHNGSASNLSDNVTKSSKSDSFSGYTDPSFDDVLSSLKGAFEQHLALGLTFLSLTNSELMLIKKSFFVTVFTSLAMFAVGTVCWLILNITIGAVMHTVGVNYILISLVLLLFNTLIAFLLFKLTQHAFRYLNFNRLIKTWKRVM